MPPRTQVPREERTGRPLILQDDGTMVAYERASSYGDILDDPTNLWMWKIRNTMKGLVGREDLRMLVSTADPDTWEGKKTLNSVAGKAQYAAKSDSAANMGTALHSAMEAVDRGETPPSLPPRFQADIESYASLMKREGLKVVHIEEFVVNDPLQGAGTFDKAVVCPDGKVRIVDFKTGKWRVRYPGEYGIQLAIYANAKRYDPATGKRSVIHPDLVTDYGIIVSLPAGSGEAQAHKLPLELPLQAARTAFWIRNVWHNYHAEPYGQEELL